MHKNKQKEKQKRSGEDRIIVFKGHCRPTNDRWHRLVRRDDDGDGDERTTKSSSRCHWIFSSDQRLRCLTEELVVVTQRCQEDCFSLSDQEWSLLDSDWWSSIVCVDGSVFEVDQRRVSIRWFVLESDQWLPYSHESCWSIGNRSMQQHWCWFVDLGWLSTLSLWKKKNVHRLSWSLSVLPSNPLEMNLNSSLVTLASRLQLSFSTLPKTDKRERHTVDDSADISASSSTKAHFESERNWGDDDNSETISITEQRSKKVFCTWEALSDQSDSKREERERDNSPQANSIFLVSMNNSDTTRRTKQKNIFQSQQSDIQNERERKKMPLSSRTEFVMFLLQFLPVVSIALATFIEWLQAHIHLSEHLNQLMSKQNIKNRSPYFVERKTDRVDKTH